MKSSLADAKIYLVLDRQVKDYDQLFEILKESVKGGIDVVQLRDKTGASRAILEFSRRALQYLRKRIPFIINDRVDLAFAARADGVHLGQDDLSIQTARKILGERAVIGISCQTIPQAIQAQKRGADYIGFGSVFKTLTKPDRREMDLDILAQVISKIKIPVFAIGGIDAQNIGILRRAGVQRVALTRAICLADDIQKIIAHLQKVLESKESVTPEFQTTN